MTAWRCNRCGEFFETKSEDSDNFEKYQDIMYIVKNALHHDLPEKVDLCPPCTSSFVAWFKKANTTGADWDENKD